LGLICAVTVVASAQVGGGLYVFGAAFDFTQVAERALAQNASGTRFYMLAVGNGVRALSLTAPEELVEVRQRVASANAVFLVCQRDIASGAFTLGDLVPGVVAVRGWPPPGSNELPAGTNFYPDEDPSTLPQVTEALRRLRATCT
jgi:hypothetical protein